MTMSRNEDLTYTVACECGAEVTVIAPWARGHWEALALGWAVSFMRHGEPRDLCPKCVERKAQEERIDAELRAEGVDVEGLLADVAAIRAKANGVDRPAGDA